MAKGSKLSYRSLAVGILVIIVIFAVAMYFQREGFQGITSMANNSMANSSMANNGTANNGTANNDTTNNSRNYV